ncbi:hypothetical protein H4W00_001397 [Psychrobacter sp. PL19]
MLTGATSTYLIFHFARLQTATTLSWVIKSYLKHLKNAIVTKLSITKQ